MTAYISEKDQELLGSIVLKTALISTISVLAQYDVTILNVGQTDIHNHLTLGILFSDAPVNGLIMKTLCFRMAKWVSQYFSVLFP